MANRALIKQVNLFHENPVSIVSNEFKRIKVNVEYASEEKNNNCYLITSPAAGEGKTLIASELAITFAKEGKKVLLIDSAVHSSSVHSIFNLDNNDGLTNVLAGQTKLEDALKESMLERLSILTAGELVYSVEKLYQSTAMNKLLSDVKNKFDYVFIDSMPVNDSMLSKIIAGKSDGCILVIKSHSTDREKAVEAKKALEIAHADLVGVIVNAVRHPFYKIRNKS